MEMNNDIKSQLINAVPIYVKGIGNVFPLKMNEIALCIESNYNTVIGLFTRTLDDLDLEEEQKKQDISYFDFVIFSCLKDEFLTMKVENILSRILREEVSLEKENLCFFIGDKRKEVDADKVKLIDKDTFDDFSDVLRFQNCIEKTKPKEKKKKLNPKLEKLKKQREKGRKLLQEAKGEDFSMADIHSTLGIFYKDLEKVSRMTIYQVNDQYNKFMRKEKYENQYSTYLAGADPKKLDLNTHWSAKQKIQSMDDVPPPN